MLKSATESIARRKVPRLEIGLLVELEHGKGWTRDVSASGVFFETDEPLAPGVPIRFSMLLDQSSTGPLRLECVGRIVRVEQQDGRLGVAATFTVSRLVPVDRGGWQDTRRFRLAGPPPA